MKFVFRLGVSAFLILSLTACNQSTANTSVNLSADNTTKNNGANYSNNAPSTAKNNNQVPVTVTDTVDGDTIKVLYGGKKETVRYLLVDTPEEKKPGVCVQPYALDAANRNKQLLNSGNVTLEFEQGKSRTDKYGRLLAYVFVNGTSVQETLLKEGYARVAYIYEPPYKYLNQYENDENAAKNKHLHIWSKPGYVTDGGFKGCAEPSAAAANQQSSVRSQTSSTGGSEYFANCTELRKKYPVGVPKGSPAYRPALDRDNDGVACER